MIVPTGIAERQTLTLVVKSGEGKVSAQDLLPVRFSELEEPAGMAGMA
jgi:protein-L-isoaspartate O-methyltransferase